MSLRIDAEVRFMVSTFTPLHIVGEQPSHEAMEISGIMLSRVKKAFIMTKTGNLDLDFTFVSDNHISISIKEVMKSPNNCAFFIILMDDMEGWYPVGPIIRANNAKYVELESGTGNEDQDTDNEISV